MTDSINIDARPYIAEEFWASVDVRDGRPVLMPTDPARWVATLRKMHGVVKVTIQRPRLRRSTEANAYYWACVLADTLSGLRQLATDAGGRCPFASAEELHEALKYMFLGVESVDVPGGGTMERPATTTILNSKQFATYIESCKEWSAARGIYVREAGEEVTA